MFVCVQNGKTKSNDAAMQGVRDFKADARFASATTVMSRWTPPTERRPPSWPIFRFPPTRQQSNQVFLLPPRNSHRQVREGRPNKEILVEWSARPARLLLAWRLRSRRLCPQEMMSDRLAICQQNITPKARPLRRPAKIRKFLDPQYMRIRISGIFSLCPCVPAVSYRTSRRTRNVEQRVKRTRAVVDPALVGCHAGAVLDRPAAPPPGGSRSRCQPRRRGPREGCQGQQVPVHLLLRGTRRDIPVP